MEGKYSVSSTVWARQKPLVKVCVFPLTERMCYLSRINEFSFAGKAHNCEHRNSLRNYSINILSMYKVT